MEASKKDVRIREVQCYDCSKPFPRDQLVNLRGGDVLICAGCKYGRNRRKAKASIRLKKRNIV